MPDLTDKTRVAWPVLVMLLTVAFGLGGAWVQLLSHGTTIDKHGNKLEDHEARIVHQEDHWEAVHQWMTDHK